MKTIAVLLPLLGIVAADTLSLKFYSAPSCSAIPFQNFTIGVLNECHNTVETYHAFYENHIASSFFGRNLRVFSFSDQNCEGDFSQLDLSNGLCGIEEGKSFKIATKTS